MKATYKALAVLALATTAVTVNAQEFRSSYFMQTVNLRHQMNPALLDSTYVTALFGGINVGTTGNVGVKNFIYKLDGNPQYDLTTFMSPTVSSGEFLGGLHDKNRLDVYLNYNLFSYAFRAFKGVNVVELNLRSNTNVSLPYELFEFMKTAGAREHYSLEDIGARSQNYVELALGHSHKINDRLTIGAKAKLLFGLAYADLSVNKLDLTMTGDKWAIDGDARLKASVFGTSLDHKENTADKTYDAPDGRKRVDGLDDISGGLSGFGLAFDLGATYKINDDLTVSAAVTDLGFISWNKTQQASSAGQWEFDGFNNIYAGSHTVGSQKLGDQFEDMGDDLEELFSVYDDGETATTQALAATVNLGAEYTLPAYRNLRFGLLYTGRIHGLYSYHQAQLSAIVRPVKWVEATVNTAVTSTGMTFGGALSLKAKHFDFYVGADRFFGKLAKSCYLPLNKCNSNLTFGMTIPL